MPHQILSFLCALIFFWLKWIFWLAFLSFVRNNFSYHSRNLFIACIVSIWKIWGAMCDQLSLQGTKSIINNIISIHTAVDWEFLQFYMSKFLVFIFQWFITIWSERYGERAHLRSKVPNFSWVWRTLNKLPFTVRNLIRSVEKLDKFTNFP